MKEELATYIRARYPLLWIVTPEEVRALAEIEQLAAHGHSDTLLHGWRRRLVGERLLAVREGRAVVSVEQGRVTID